MRLNVTIILCVVCSIGVECDTVVETENGKVRGTILKSNMNRNIYSFMGIPYAESPVGQLRFKPPTAKFKWHNILNCTEAPPICPQEDYFRKTKITGSEDCLYLNIYTPQLQSKELLPVMIFIHGGAFAITSGNLNNFGPQILLDKDIVLATINYRLGPLGFLSTQDEVVPGNNGLKDQNFAIQWIKRNIHNFGGDPKKIVIFGQSVGSVSVHFQMMSSLSKGLFHGAISESGTALSLWALDTNSTYSNSKALANFFNCPTQSSKEMIDCLRNVDAYEIVKSNRRFSKWDIEPTIRFTPVIEPNVEGAFLTQHPIEIIRSGKVMQIPWIVGSSTEEGSIRAAGIYSKSSLVLELNDDFNRIAPILFGYPRDDGITKKIREFYFQKQKINNVTRRNFINMYTDGRYFSGIHEAVRVHLKYTNGPVYYYLFGYKGSQSYSKSYGGGSENYGVCHGDEFLYLSSNEHIIAESRPDIFDQFYTELMSTLWTNFAKTLNPSIDAPNQVIPSTWDPATLGNMDCYYLGNDIHMAKDLRGQRAQFWKNLNLHPSNNI